MITGDGVRVGHEVEHAGVVHTVGTVFPEVGEVAAGIVGCEYKCAVLANRRFSCSDRGVGQRIHRDSDLRGVVAAVVVHHSDTEDGVGNRADRHFVGVCTGNADPFVAGSGMLCIGCRRKGGAFAQADFVVTTDGAYRQRVEADGIAGCGGTVLAVRHGDGVNVLGVFRNYSDGVFGFGAAAPCIAGAVACSGSQRGVTEVSVRTDGVHIRGDGHERDGVHRDGNQH